MAQPVDHPTPQWLEEDGHLVAAVDAARKAHAAHAVERPSYWTKAEEEYLRAPSEPEADGACTECGKTLANGWTGQLSQGTHERCWAARRGLDPDRHLLGLAQLG